MNSDSNNSNGDFNFEQAMEEIKQIVSDIEAGNLSLDESIKKYERALQLIRKCQELLQTTHQRIEDLTVANQIGKPNNNGASDPK